MAGTHVSKLHLRLFLEGLEVPVISASVSASMNSPAMAQVEIVPSDAAMRMRPRTTVHLFFLSAHSQEDLTGSTDVFGNDVGPGHAYKLMFCGEVFDIEFSKNGAGSRSIVLSCMDFSSLWDTTYLYLLRFVTGRDDPNTRTVINKNGSTFFGAPELFDDTGTNSPMQLVARLASQSKAASTPGFDKVTDNIGGLLTILELIGGVQGATVGLYDWSTVQERRIRLMDQIATDSGKTAAQAFDQGTLERWLTNQIGESGEVISFREIIETIMGFVYYGVAPQPVAIYRDGTRLNPKFEVHAAGTADLNVDMVAAFAWISDDMKGKGFAPEQGSSVRPSTDSHETTPGAHVYGCAIDVNIAGLSTSGFNYSKDKGFTTKVYSVAEMQAGTSKEPLAWARAYANQYPPSANSRDAILGLIRAESGAGQEVAYNLENIWNFYKQLELSVAAFNATRTPSTDTKNKKWNAASPPLIEITWGGTYKVAGKGQDPGMTPADIHGDYLHIALSDWKERAEPTASTTATFSPAAKSKIGDKARQKLYTQIFRPDCWFVAPPVCNIIYPEEYTSFSFRRQMMREITRLELDTFSIMIDEQMLQTVYFAPRIDGFAGLTTSGKTSADAPVVYKHERFSGIIPKTERMPDLPFYAKQQLGNVKTEASGEVDVTASPAAYDDAAGMDVISNFASRAVNFHFMSYRYAARSLTITGQFMPRLILGFPAVVVDRPQANAESKPIHYLGQIVTLQHSISQTGGFTSVSMSHARSHKTDKNEIDDLFSEYGAEGGTKLDTQSATTSGTINIPFVGVAETDLPSGTFKDWEILMDKWIREQRRNWVATQNATNTAAAEAAAAAAASSPTYVGPTTPTSTLTTLKDAPRSWVSVELRSAAVKGPNGKPLIKLSIGGSAPTSPAGNTLTEFRDYNVISFKENSTADQLLPLEEALRPPWFDEEYSNEKIGVLYDRLFGCRSIIDITGEKSVEDAIDNIVAGYSRVAENAEGRTTAVHIYKTTRRSMASLPTVLTAVPSGNNSGAFHYYTVGDFDKFEGLELRNPVDEFGDKITLVTPYLGTPTSGQARKLFDGPEAEYLDVRKDRRATIKAYRDLLLTHRGLRG